MARSIIMMIIIIMEEHGNIRQERSEEEPHPSTRLKFNVYALVFVFIALYFFVVITIYNRPDIKRYVIPSSSSTFCCPQMVRNLAELANLTLDPCVNFFNYACFNWRLQKKEEMPGFVISSILPRILQGVIRKTEERTANIFYKSCLLAVNSDLEMIARAAVNAAVKVGQLQRPITPESMLRAIVTLSLRKRFCPVRILLSLKSGSDIPDLKITVDDDCVELRLSSKNLEMHLLNAVNTIMASNVTTEDLLQLRNDITLIPKHNGTRKGNLSALKYLKPNVPLSFWKKILDEFSPVTDTIRVTIESFETVKRALEMLTWIQYRGTTVAYSLVIAASFLCRYEFRLVENTSDPRKRFQYCYRAMHISNTAWYTLITAELGSFLGDSIINTLFFATRARLIIDASNLIGTADAPLIKAKLSRLRIVLPSKIIPVDEKPPRPTDNLFQNKLTYGLWVQRLRMLKLKDGVPRQHIAEVAPWTTNIPIIDDYVLVPSGAYAFLSFENGKDLVNAAILGVAFADAFWQVIFESHEWTQAGQNQLTTIQSCLPNLSLRRNPLGFMFPMLSLQTAANSVRDDLWHRQVFTWSLLTSSECRVFYMVFAYHHMCIRVIEDSSLLNAFPSSQEFLKTLPDFQRGFQCAPPPQSLKKDCIPPAVF